MRKGSYNGSETQKQANRTMTVASNFKFQNLERLNTIVGEVSDRNNKEIAMRSGKLGMSDKVLDMIKNRIKTNYDKLYQNYDDNKKNILKQINQVQKNMSSENTINKGFQHVIKQKSAYDKAKADLQAKQRKLKKLTEVRDQLKGGNVQNVEFNEVITQKCTLMQNLQSYKQILDYQTAVLNNMKGDRRQVKLFLKQKYDKMLGDQQFKKQRIKKLQNINHNKKAQLKRIEEDLKKQQHCQIPENLAEQLQRKLQQYQGKHVYENIIKHENIISEQFRKKCQIEQAQQKQEQRKNKLQRQKQETKQYELAYNFYLIKQQQQEKIKKICGVSSLSQIVNNNIQSDFENLQTIKKQIQLAIDELKKQNQLIKEQISSILTGKQLYDEQNLLKAEQDYVKAQKEMTNLQINSQRKYKYLNQWHSLIQMMMQKQVTKDQLGQGLKQILDRIVNKQKNSDKKRFSMKNFQTTLDNNNQMSSKFKKIKDQYQSECSIIENQNL